MPLGDDSSRRPADVGPRLPGFPTRRSFSVLALGALGLLPIACAGAAGSTLKCVFRTTIGVISRGKDYSGSSTSIVTCYPMPDLDGLGGWGVALRGVAPVVDLGPDGVLIGLLQADPLDELSQKELYPVEIKDLPFAIVSGASIAQMAGKAGRHNPDVLLPQLPVSRVIRLNDNLLPRLAWVPNRNDVNSRIFSDPVELDSGSGGKLSEAKGWFEQVATGEASMLPDTGRWASQLHEQ